jgi:ATP/ADP translocase
VLYTVCCLSKLYTDKNVCKKQLVLKEKEETEKEEKKKKNNNTDGD